jgi:hypothetical protein
MRRAFVLAGLLVTLVPVAAHAERGPQPTPLTQQRIDWWHRQLWNRPTRQEGRDVMRAVLGTYAEGLGGHLTLGVCRPYGELWLSCHARIEWKRTTTRYRFHITDAGDTYILNTRTRNERNG